MAFHFIQKLESFHIPDLHRAVGLVVARNKFGVAGLYDKGANRFIILVKRLHHFLIFQVYEINLLVTDCCQDLALFILCDAVAAVFEVLLEIDAALELV